jgi:hypothetical protein
MDFRQARHSARGLSIAPERLGEILWDSEREIRRVQGLTSFDRYWRVYFFLVGGTD